jgi:hypothetical protein
MAKVVTGTGLNEFIETGKHEVIAPDKPEIKKAQVAAPPPEEKPVEAAKPAETPPADEGLEPEDVNLSEIVRKKIGKKHRAMKEALETAAESDRFAEAQFNERRLVEQERDQLKAERDALAAKVAPPKPVEVIKEPDVNDSAYRNEKGEFDFDKFRKDERKFTLSEAQRQQNADIAAQRAAAIEAQVRARVEVAEKTYPDFKQVLTDTPLLAPNGVLNLIGRHEKGPDLAYYLAKNPEEMKRINAIAEEDGGDPTRAIAEAGLIIRDKFQAKAVETPAASTAATAAPKSTAPPPITPISSASAGTVELDPSKMGFRQLREYERNKAKRR